MTQMEKHVPSTCAHLCESYTPNTQAHINTHTQNTVKYSFMLKNCRATCLCVILRRLSVIVHVTDYRRTAEDNRTQTHAASNTQDLYLDELLSVDFL